MQFLCEFPRLTHKRTVIHLNLHKFHPTILCLQPLPLRRDSLVIFAQEIRPFNPRPPQIANTLRRHLRTVRIQRRQERRRRLRGHIVIEDLVRRRYRRVHRRKVDREPRRPLGGADRVQEAGYEDDVDQPGALLGAGGGEELVGGESDGLPGYAVSDKADAVAGVYLGLEDGADV